MMKTESCDDVDFVIIGSTWVCHCQHIQWWQNWHYDDFQFSFDDLTHWGRVTHICVVKLIMIGSDNGLSPGWRQAIIWTNTGILLIWPWGTSFSEILIGIHTFSFKKIHLKMSSAKMASILSRPQCVKVSITSYNISQQIFKCAVHCCTLLWFIILPIIFRIDSLLMGQLPL